jgi:hypothetical protein
VKKIHQEDVAHREGEKTMVAVGSGLVPMNFGQRALKTGGGGTEGGGLMHGAC